MEIIAVGLVVVGLVGYLIVQSTQRTNPPKIINRYEYYYDYDKNRTQAPPPPNSKEALADEKILEAQLGQEIYEEQDKLFKSMTRCGESKAEAVQAQITIKRMENDLIREERATDRIELEDVIARERLETVERKQIERDVAELEAEIREFLRHRPDELSDLERQAAEAIEKIRLGGVLLTEQIRSFMSQAEIIEQFKRHMYEKYGPEEAKTIIDAFQRTVFQNKTM